MLRRAEYEPRKLRNNELCDLYKKTHTVVLLEQNAFVLLE